MLLSFGMLFLGSVSFAQQGSDGVTQEEYRRYIDNKIKMNFRNKTIEALGLTAAEIEEFDPIFTDYMAKKEQQLEKRLDLLEDFRDEIAEDDSEKNEQEDRADFIEDYWEIDIAEMELRKDYFDKLEDKIDKSKAARFFFWEDAVSNNLTDNTVANMLPAVFDLNKYQANTTMTVKPMPSSANASAEDYSKYIDGRLKMDFRNETIKALGLTNDEITKFDPFLRNYMAQKEALLGKRMDLLEDFREEMAEDDSVENEEEDKADFTEDYWEIEIAEMELRKDQFDILEDLIDKDKAAKFFFWEDAIENRIAMNVLLSMMPTLGSINYIESKEIAPVKAPEKTLKKGTLSLATKTSIENFDKWVNMNKGKVDVSHDYSSNGLKALVGVIENLKIDMKTDIPNFTTKTQMIKDNAHEITVDYTSLDHADMIKEAFVAIADIMNYFESGTEMRNAANSIDVDKMTTKQANKIYRFFDAANASLQKIYRAELTTGM